MRLIDADELYEKTAEWEASALAKIEELNRTPLEEMDDAKKNLWRKWTAILNERSAFKHDVFDAPTIEPPQWIPVTKRLPNPNEVIGHSCKYYLVQTEYGDMMCCSWNGHKWEQIFQYEPIDDTIVAWMPLPAPMEGGAE